MQLVFSSSGCFTKGNSARSPTLRKASMTGVPKLENDCTTQAEGDCPQNRSERDGKAPVSSLHLPLLSFLYHVTHCIPDCFTETQRHSKVTLAFQWKPTLKSKSQGISASTSCSYFQSFSLLQENATSHTSMGLHWLGFLRGWHHDEQGEMKIKAFSFQYAACKGPSVPCLVLATVISPLWCLQLWRRLETCNAVS